MNKDLGEGLGCAAIILAICLGISLLIYVSRVY